MWIPQPSWPVAHRTRELPAISTKPRIPADVGPATWGIGTGGMMDVMSDAGGGALEAVSVNPLGGTGVTVGGVVLLLFGACAPGMLGPAVFPWRSRLST